MRMFFEKFGGGNSDILFYRVKEKHCPDAVGETFYPRHLPLYIYCISGRLDGLTEKLLSTPLVT